MLQPIRHRRRSSRLQAIEARALTYAHIASVWRWLLLGFGLLALMLAAGYGR
jgi:hypothetical protein